MPRKACYHSLNMKLRSAALPFLAAQTILAAVDAQHSFRGRGAVLLTNGAVELTVLKHGGSFASIVLAGDAERNNPMWDALRANRESGRPERQAGGTGHFVCVDGFGPPSAAEAAAGMQGHGEAHRLPWAAAFAGIENGDSVLRQAVTLPRVHELLQREVRLKPGENVVYVKSSLTSLLDFDRPVNWAEHATIGSPFLERGVTVVDMSPNRALTRPRAGPPSGGRVHRLIGNKDFAWPLAPAGAGVAVDLRAAPLESHSLDHTGHLMDPTREWAFVTALHTEKRLLIGYLFRTSAYPWLQTWENYPREGMLARGLEFGTQAFDRPRREMVTQGRLFGRLLYRWLPARGRIDASYLLFWTRMPEGFRGVDEVQWSGGKLRIADRRSGQVVELAASGEL